MTIRLKLTLGAIAILLMANSLLSLVSMVYVEKVWLGEIQDRVRLDLKSARAAYNFRINDITRFLEAVALDDRIGEASLAADRSALAGLLDDAYKAGGMDFLTVVAPGGNALYRPNNPLRHGDNVGGDLLVAEAIHSRQPASGTLILSAQRLAAEDQDLGPRARFDIQPTPAARRTDEKTRNDGMVLAAAVPLTTENGQFAGLLYGGRLLNRSYDIVDKIKQVVLPQQRYRGREIGAVTIFQGDLRVSTNVIGRDGSRAVGTRLSEAVYNEVLQKGLVWAEPAFVVDNWYISAYEPIRDPAGKIIGALYVGLLQSPFLEQKNAFTVVLLVMVTVATASSLLLLYLATMRVLRPIGRIIDMSRTVVAGDLSARVGIRAPGEMGDLCRAVDEMADAVAQREDRLKAATRQQIGRSEKLASLGRLAAGVAHEINNPLTGVLTFSHLLRDKANMDEQDKQDLDLIIHETSRAAEIVRGLLDFARERAAMKEPLDINDCIRRTLKLIRNQKSYDRITISEELQDGLPEVDGDMNQLQQVLLNLSLNACEAMPEGGKIVVRTASDNGNVLVRVSDNGCGIKREHLEQIYEPFFSTKSAGKGTGLGLSVSYGIVQQHGGTIEVESEEGNGTTFTIVLPGCYSGRKPT
ncbi:MAG: HAMP domain-containing protein [Rhodopirellula sp.]|nr:HAMP domain-containing protein [Rhodopirellula sp.]